MGKKILFKKDARVGVMKGIDAVANAVKVTMGYGGRTVIISDQHGPARATKDGVTVADSISFTDEIMNAGAKMIKEVSQKTANDVGDGTTCVCLLMQRIVQDGLSLIETGVNPMDLKKGMELAVTEIVSHLEKIKVDVGDDINLLKQVATVSANNDEEIGEIIGEIFHKIGKYGIVSIEDSMNDNTEIQLIDGFQFDSGYVSNYFINNSEANLCELENPYVLLVDDKISRIDDIWELLNKVATERRPIVIFADDFDFNTIGTMIKNINKGVFKACCVKYNYIGEAKEELMLDLCALTNATLISEKVGKKIDAIKVSDLGECEKIVLSKGETTIAGNKKNTSFLEQRIEDAKIKIEQAKNQFVKERAERRLSKLSGCIAICRVGAMTQVERDEKKDRVDDAVRATKAAIQEGIVPGGGIALLRCIAVLDKLKVENEGQQIGINLIKKAIEAPAYQITENANQRLAGYLMKDETGNIGWNVKTGQKEDLVKSGIIDPKKVVRLCIENAASAAAQVLISEALIIEEIN